MDCAVGLYLEGKHEKIIALSRAKQVCIKEPGSHYLIQGHLKIQWEKGELPVSCFMGETVLRRMNLLASKNKIKSNTCTNTGKQTGSVHQEFQSLEISPSVFFSPFHSSKQGQQKPLFDQERLSILHSHEDQQRFGLSGKEGVCHGLVSASTCISSKHPKWTPLLSHTESWNYGLVWVSRDLKDQLVLPLAMGRDTFC